ncbi:MAG: hypothetical protein V4659_00835 [Pseudomonadota bacterium]
MRKTTFSIALLGTALAAAAPAAAQQYGNGGYDQGRGDYGRGDYGRDDRGRGDYQRGDRQLWQLSAQVDRAIQSGQLSRREADWFRREVTQLRYLDQRYERGGYNRNERRAFDQRVDRLRDRLRRERRDGDYDGGRYRSY